MSATLATTDENEPHSAQRDALEHEADVAKEKLLRTLERLDDKRHDAMETALHVRNDALVVGVLGGVLLGVLLGELRARRRNRPRHLLDRLGAAVKAFRRA
jgi:hypothetical protein